MLKNHLYSGLLVNTSIPLSKIRMSVKVREKNAAPDKSTGKSKFRTWDANIRTARRRVASAKRVNMMTEVCLRLLLHNYILKKKGKKRKEKKEKTKKWNTLIPLRVSSWYIATGDTPTYRPDDEWVTSVRISRETSKRKVGRLYTCGPLPLLLLPFPPRWCRQRVCNGRQCRDQ